MLGMFQAFTKFSKWWWTKESCNTQTTKGARLEKNTCYAEYVRHSCMIAPRILGCIRHNMACTELGASASRNSQHTRESRCTWLVKLAQKGQENGQRSKKGQQKLGKLLTKGQQNFEVTKKRSTKYFSKADTIFIVRRVQRKLGA